MKRQEFGGEPHFEQVITEEIQASGPAYFRKGWYGDRRDFLKLAGVTAVGVLVLGPPNTHVEAPAPFIDIEFEVDERLKAKGKLTAVSYNTNFTDRQNLLRDAWWSTAHAAWQRTNGEKISHDEYNDMVKQAAATGDHTPLMFSVGGTDKMKSPYNMSTLEIDPLNGTKVLVVDDGVYGGLFLGMEFDEVRAAYAPDDKQGQRIVTETIRKQFGFSKDGDGQLVTMFNWQPSVLSGESESWRLTDGFTEALSLLAGRNPGIHNMSRLPGSSEDEAAFFRRTRGPYMPLFGLDSQGDRIGLLTAPEFSK